MSGKIFRFALFLAFIAGLPHANPTMKAQARAGEISNAQYLEMLADVQGVPSASLELADVGTVELIDGSTVTRVKALDRATHQPLGASFRDGKAVDETALREQVTRAWRNAHGRLTYPLVQKLQNSFADETFTVSVWLMAEIEALPKSDKLPPPAVPDGIASPDFLPSTPDPALPSAMASPTDGKEAEQVDGKIIEKPLPIEQVPPEVIQALGGALPYAQAPETGSKAKEVPAEPTSSPAQSPEKLQKLAEAQKFDRLNIEHLKAQVAGPRAQFLAYAASQGFEVQYASETAPIVVLSGLSRAQVEELAFAAGVDAVYDASLPGGATLDVARVTQNANIVEVPGGGYSVGYNGSGVNVAVVEGERMFTGNPYLTVSGTRDPNRAFKDHPTAVGGMIASRHTTVRGLAPGAAIYSANGDDYTTIAAIEAAMDWGSSQASVLNNSYWTANCGVDSSLYGVDRHLDYIVRNHWDAVQVAAGNFEGTTDCDGTNPPVSVSSPGKGFNPLTVGVYGDNNTLGWADDAIASWSQYNHSGRIKPEIAASGVLINSTTRFSPWTGNTGSGTSYSTPMISAVAADMIDAEPDLMNRPEALHAILMATALHNIEGDARLSSKDGSGGMVASAALVSVERDNYTDTSISGSTTFPLNFTAFAYAGDRVRYVIRWLSNPSSDYTSDPQPVDLDLTVYRPDNTTFVTSSLSSANNYEIVDFVAPVTGSYNFRVSYWAGSWSGSTWLGTGWWRDSAHYPPNTTFTYPKAPPMGIHSAMDPTLNPGQIYWRVMGIRSPSATDHDLQLYSRSWFDDPGLRALLANSPYAAGSTDFIAVNGNYWGTAVEQYRTNWFSGTGTVQQTYTTKGRAIVSHGIYGPYTLGTGVVDVSDIYFKGGANRIITVVPSGANTADLGAFLFKSTSGTPSTYARPRGLSAAYSSSSSNTAVPERLQYKNSGSGDWLGLVVSNENGGFADYYIVVEDLTFLPTIRR